MAKTIATLMGVIFIVVGLVGFAVPGLLGAHLSPAHNVIHLVSGAVSLYLGLKGTLSGAKTFCIVFGAVYGLLGLAGFAFGVSAGAHTSMLNIIPGTLELGTMDHIIHILIAAVYLIGGFTTKQN